MAALNAHGIEVRLPPGFGGHLFVRTVGATPVGHFATFVLPPDLGDFGGDAVARMRPTDIFAVLFEYGPESVGTALFAHQGMPRRLETSDFRPYVLKRGVGWQSGVQRFFTESRRPFTLYAVLGAHAKRDALVPRLNHLLRGVTVHESNR